MIVGGCVFVSSSLRQLRCPQHSAFHRSYLETRGDFILVGDMMKSLSLLRYRPEAGMLEEVAADPGQAWMTAIAMLDDATFLGADADLNLFSAARNLSAGASEDARSRLDIAGTFHLGDMVNRFRPGSLVLLPPEHAEAVATLAAETARLEQLQLQQAAAAVAQRGDGGAASAGSGGGGAGSKRARSAAAAEVGGVIDTYGEGSSVVGMSANATAAAEFLSRVPRPRFVFGTVGGAVGAVLSLPPATYVKLRLLQRSIARAVPAVGGLSHSTWRSWFNPQAPLAVPPQLLGGGGGDDEAMFDDGSVSGGSAGALAGDATRGFIDGDLVETFADLPRGVQERVVADMNARGAGVVSDAAPPPAAKAPAAASSGGASIAAASAAATAVPVTAPLFTVEDVSRLVEELQRLH